MDGGVLTKLTCVTALLCWARPTDGARILLLPFFHYSHVNFFSVAGVALKEAGHEVHVLSIPKYKDTIVKAGLNHLIFETTRDDDIHRAVDGMAADVAKGQDASFFATIRKTLPVFSDMCAQIQRDSEFMKKVESLNFDLAMVDGLPVFSCIYVLPYRFGIKHVTLSAMHDPWTMGIPAMPSVEPHQMTSFSNPMSFLQRVKNTIPYLALYLAPISYFYSAEHMNEFITGKEHSTFSALARKSEIYMVLLDGTCFDYPRVSAPHYKFVGGVSAKPAKPLPPEFAEFVDGAKHGVILVSFGSVKAWQAVWTRFKKPFMEAFSRMEQRVVVQYSTPEDREGVPANVKLSSWIPQNDLLGHPNARLFVTHGGNNGQLESVYHGVPMLTIPFSGDQFYNGIRAESRGYGKMLERSMATAQNLYETMQELVYNTTYRENVRKCSAIMKSLPSPQDNIVFWVDHVLRFGGGHLRPPSFDLSFFSVFMIDVLLFFLLIIAAVTFILVCCCRYICRLCRPKAAKTKSE